MTDSEKIFFDTAPFIYLIENHPEFCLKVETLITDFAAQNASFYTSVLTHTEFNVQPLKIGRPELIEDFENILSEIGFISQLIDLTIAKKAAQLRARYNLKTIDSLQVATALQIGCSKFITNDLGLKRVSELEIIVLTEF